MSIRDLKAAELIRDTNKLGGLETEFIVHGFGYIENGKVKYRISEKKLELYHFYQECGFKGIYPTPLMTTVYRESVPPDLYEEVSQKMKLQLASNIKETYSTTYFTQLKRLMEIPATNGAKDIIGQQIEEAEGLFDTNQLLKIEGLALLAFESKQLTQDDFRQVQHWLVKNYMQLEGKITAKEKYEKTFYGFTFLNEKGDLEYLENALEETILEKQIAYLKKGLLVSPIYVHTYWSEQMPQIRQLRENFKERLVHVMTEKYLALCQQIKKLPSVIDGTVYEEALQIVKDNCTEEAVNAFEQYRYIWNIG